MWVVLYKDCDDNTSICGVFSSEEKAIKSFYHEGLKIQPYCYIDDNGGYYRLDEFEIDVADLPFSNISYRKQNKII